MHEKVGKDNIKMEEEKLKVLKEIKEEKNYFFNRFFEYMDNK